VIYQACWSPSDLAADAAAGLDVTYPDANDDAENGGNGDPFDALVDMAHAKYKHTKLLGSTHVVGAWTSRQRAVELFQRCGLRGRADGAKVRALTRGSRMELRLLLVALKN